MRSRLFPLLLLAAGAVLGWAAADRRTAAVAADTPVPAPAPQPEGAEAGVRAITAEYAKAFNAGDAKAAAALWTANGEYVGADGDTLTGRDEIAKGLAAYFQAHPKATAEIRLESVRQMGRGLASVEGVVSLKVPGEPAAAESRYTALHVLEDGKWHAASVREWVPDPATAVSPRDLEWLVGDWESKGAGGAVAITYAWDADKVFLTGKYSLTRDGNVVSRGTQVIGKNPDGGLRAWMFDSSGTTSQAVWVRDDDRWLNDATGQLPDGTEVTSASVLIPLGPDAFTWQTMERAADGITLPPLPPIKVTRVKK